MSILSSVDSRYACNVIMRVESQQYLMLKHSYSLVFQPISRSRILKIHYDMNLSGNSACMQPFALRLFRLRFLFGMIFLFSLTVWQSLCGMWLGPYGPCYSSYLSPCGPSHSLRLLALYFTFTPLAKCLRPDHKLRTEPPVEYPLQAPPRPSATSYRSCGAAFPS